ncbi:uncharacterized protein MYCFIDRAFT_174823 [Pseudocercospora fijiensis CIRAD86]|uniref:Uncharacterized protein n=1 Tax=Pseudocercospora fijiensis (strain CIRAD86) TaxID=383855 RepID=M2ZWK1_PSEFD|nr:uncharacterized protein MYCFIDRAFT_174823 [Pseudocercospora fijiensis CIRAD86]EME83374.1 hypothetical protein MYCFIDRAFT_174823 [Pseudocercospora fijiensis CIRAD86]
MCSTQRETSCYFWKHMGERLRMSAVGLGGAIDVYCIPRPEVDRRHWQSEQVRMSQEMGSLHVLSPSATRDVAKLKPVAEEAGETPRLLAYTLIQRQDYTQSDHSIRCRLGAINGRGPHRHMPKCPDAEERKENQ